MRPRPDSLLADPRQVIAELQLANAELRRTLDERTAERDKSEDQKAALAGVLDVINSSLGDLAPVFDAMLEQAMRLCGAAFGMFSTYDGEAFRLASSCGVPPVYAEHLARVARVRAGRPGRSGALERIVNGEPTVHIADITTEEAYRSGNHGRRALADLGGARTTVWVALRKDEILLGQIAMYRQEVRSFTDGQIALLQNFAATPHLNRVVHSTLRMQDAEARAAAASEITDRMHVGLVVTDASGKVSEANQLATVIIDEADGLFIRNGVLRAARRADDLELARLIFEAAGGFTESATRPSGVMQIARPSQRRPLPLMVSPIRNSSSPLGRVRAVSITFSDPEQVPELDRESLARLYRLTRREAAVAALLLQGNSPAAAAAQLEMTMNTVRTHIRHIFEKMNVDRLSEFVRLVLRGPIAGRF